MTTHQQRDRVAVLMDALVLNRPRVHYAEVRPMRTAAIRTSAQLLADIGTSAGVTMDCSESVTLICRLAGLDDPNGLGYSGGGNTQVMYDHLPRYHAPGSAGIGALVFFGIPGELPTQHVAMVRRPGLDPMLFTHGTESDPSYHPLSWMRSGFPGTPVFLSIAHL